jgi:hypothetical protein
MFVADETATSRSQVTFFRCSLCVSEHVSAEPIAEFTQFDSFNREVSDAAVSDTKRYLMI